MFIRKKKFEELVSRIEVLETKVDRNTRSMDFRWKAFLEHLKENKEKKHCDK